jgi:hypothetical protein
MPKIVMNKTKIVLIFACWGLLGLGLSTPAAALSPCEKQAAQCSREADLEFRHDKKALGDPEARNILDGRRYTCRTAMKKCKKMSMARRDLRLGRAASRGNTYRGSGSSTSTPNSTPGY